MNNEITNGSVVASPSGGNLSAIAYELLKGRVENTNDNNFGKILAVANASLEALKKTSAYLSQVPNAPVQPAVQPESVAPSEVVADATQNVSQPTDAAPMPVEPLPVEQAMPQPLPEPEPLVTPELVNPEQPVVAAEPVEPGFESIPVLNGTMPQVGEPVQLEAPVGVVQSAPQEELPVQVDPSVAELNKGEDLIGTPAPLPEPQPLEEPVTLEPEKFVEEAVPVESAPVDAQPAVQEPVVDTPEIELPPMEPVNASEPAIDNPDLFVQNDTVEPTPMETVPVQVENNNVIDFNEAVEKAKNEITAAVNNAFANLAASLSSVESTDLGQDAAAINRVVQDGMSKIEQAAQTNVLQFQQPLPEPQPQEVEQDIPLVAGL